MNSNFLLISGNTSDPYFVRDYLQSGSGAKVILDAYKAAEFREILDQPDIEIESVKKVDASYGIALAGDAKLIKHCVERYAIENSQRIMMELSNYSLIFPVRISILLPLNKQCCCACCTSLV